MFEIKKVFAKGKRKAEVFIYEDIGDGWMGGISAKVFADQLNALGRLDEINVRINSAGGAVFDGIAIHNTLLKNPATVIVDVDGLAASIASIIAMAGDEVYMSSNAMMMIHDPWIVAGGSADELREQADLLDKVRGQLLATYVSRSNADEQAVSDMMTAETWMTADEALAAGFIDSVTDEMKVAAYVDPSKFKNVPKALLDKSNGVTNKALEVKKPSENVAVNGKVLLMRAKVASKQLTSASAGE